MSRKPIDLPPCPKCGMYSGERLTEIIAEGAVPMLGVPKKRKNAAKRTWRPKPCPYNDAITCDAVECLPECGWRHKNTVEESKNEQETC